MFTTPVIGSATLVDILILIFPLAATVATIGLGGTAVVLALSAKTREDAWKILTAINLMIAAPVVIGVCMVVSFILWALACRSSTAQCYLICR